MERSSGHDPGLQEGGLPFGLSLVDGRGVITLCRPAPCGPARLESLELEIPGIRFPFDVSGGARRFRHRRCRLSQGVLRLQHAELAQWLPARLATGHAGHFRSIGLQLGAGALNLSGRMAAGGDSAPFLLRGFIEPNGGGLRVCLCDLWVFGPFPVSAPELAGRLWLQAGAGRDPDADGSLVGACDLAIDPLGLVLRWTLPRDGWRLPLRDPTQTARVGLDAEGVVVRVGGPQAETEAAPIPERFRTLQQAKDRFREAETSIVTAPDEARALFRRLLDDAPDDRFLTERLLQLLVADADNDEETLELAERSLARHSAFIPALMARGAIQLRREQWTAAGASYRWVAELCAAEGDAIGEEIALLTAGRATVTEDPTLARADFERVLDLDSSNATALAHLARLYAEGGAWQRLVLVRKRQLELTTSAERRLHTHLALGELYRVHLDDPHQALVHYRQALELDGGCEPALRGEAEACIDAEQPAEAIEALGRLGAVLAERDDTTGETAVHLRVASLFEHLGQPEQAVEHLQRVAAKDPQVLRRKAALLEQMHREQEAAEALAELLDQLSRPSDQGPVRLQLAQLWLAAGRETESRQQLELALELTPEDPAAHQLAIRLAESVGDTDRLAAALDRAAGAEREPSRRVVLLRRRALLVAEHDDRLEPTVEAVRQTLASGPGATDAIDALCDRIVELRSRRGGPADGARTAEAIAALPPDPAHQADRLFAAGQLWREQARDEDASRCYREALDRSPHHGAALDALEEVLSRGESREPLAQILALKVEAAEAQPARQRGLLERLGGLLSELGRSDEARGCFARLLELDSEATPALVHLARDAMAGQQLARAEELYRRLASALARGSSDVPPEDRDALSFEAHRTLAELSRRAGKPQQEEEHLALALAVAPHDPVALERLDALLSAQGRAAEQVELIGRRIEVVSDEDQLLELRLRRAVLLESLAGREQEAVTALRDLLDHQPDNSEALRRLSGLLRRQDRFDELLEALGRRAELAERADADDTEDAVALWLEAGRLAHSRLARPDRAEACLRHALRLSPENHEVLDALLEVVGEQGAPTGVDPALLREAGLAHRAAGRRDHALRSLRAAVRAYEKGPDRARVARELLELAEATDTDQGRQDTLTALLVLGEEDASNAERLALARLYADGGSHERAVEVLKQLPREREAAKLLLDELRTLGRHRELAEELERQADPCFQPDPEDRRASLLDAAQAWLEQVGDGARAEQAMARAASVEPLDLAVIDAIAQLLMRAGAADRFASVVEQLASDEGGHPPAMQSRILCHAARINRDTGASWRTVEEGFEEALRRDPSCLEALDGLIQLYDERVDEENLARVLTKRAETGGENARRIEALLRAAALLAERLRRPAEALELLLRARALRPEDPEVLLKLTDIQLLLGELAQAEETLVALADLGHQAEQALGRARGLAQLRGDAQAEARHLTRLSELKPDDRQVLARLAAVYEKLGDLTQQALTLDRLANLDSEVLIELARLQAGPLEDLPAARDTVARLLEHRPDHRRGLQLMVELCEELDRPTELAEHIRRLHALEPGPERRAALATQLARLERRAGRHGAAREAWQLALKDAPDDPAAIQGLAENLARQRQWEALCAFLEQRLSTGQLPTEVASRLGTLLGETYLDRLGNPYAGVRWLQRACTLSAADRPFQRLMALFREHRDYGETAELLDQRAGHLAGHDRVVVLEELGHIQEVHLNDLKAAAETFAAAFRVDPTAQLHFAVRASELFIRTNDLDGALVLLDEAIPRAEGATRGALEASRARILALRGLVPQAIEEYERALADNPKLHVARAELGRRLFERGQFDAAVPHLEAAAEFIENPKEREACAFLVQRALEKLGLGRTRERTVEVSPVQEAPRPLPTVDIVAPRSRHIQPTRELVPVQATDHGERRPHPTPEVSPIETSGPDTTLAPAPPETSPLPLTLALDEPAAAAAAEDDLEPWQWQEMVESCRQRAVASSLPQEKAQLLMKAARITEDRLAHPLEALGLYEEAVAAAPEYLGAKEALADAAYRNQDWHRARELYDHLYQHGSSLPQDELCYRRALVYETLGDDRTAESCYVQAAQLNPRHRAALEGRTRVALGRDDVEGAIEALTGLEGLVTVDEVDALAVTRTKLGELHLRAGNTQFAREYLEAALDLNTQPKKVMQTLLSVYQRMGEFKSAADLLERLISVTSSPLVRASLLHYRAEILGGELDDEEAAIDCLLKAYDLAPNYPPTLWRLIDYYWEKNDLQSVAEMGINLMGSIDLVGETPDLRHVRLSVAMLVIRGDSAAAVQLLGVALGQENLVGPAVLELGHAVVSGISTDKLTALVRDADPNRRLAARLPEVLREHPDAPGLKELAALLSVELEPQT